LKVHKELIKSKYGSGEGKEVRSLFRCKDSTNYSVRKAYVDYGDLGMDPEILRRKAATANGVNGKLPTLKTSHGIAAPPVVLATTVQV
jgi:hypothetical protein